jgi:hypothetical protein
MKQKPNIVLILTDQQAPHPLGSCRAAVARSPHIGKWHAGIACTATDLDDVREEFRAEMLRQVAANRDRLGPQVTRMLQSDRFPVS